MDTLTFTLRQILAVAIQDLPKEADHGERVERKPITGVWGGPQWGSGAEPLVGVRRAKPLP